MRYDSVRVPKLASSFMSYEKDIETILKELFVVNKPFSTDLKKLLVITNPDCLTGDYDKEIEKYTLSQLKKEDYIMLKPNFKFNEFEEKKSIIFISFDNFTQSSNPEYRDCTVSFDVICHIDTWELENYQNRPLKICGIIDGLLNESRLSGIGQFLFMGCKELVLDEYWSGYTLMFQAYHGNDDKLEKEEDEDE